MMPKEEVITTGDVAMYNANSWKTEISDTCMSFNDGCNQCMRTGTGKEDVACTRMFCEAYTQPFCTDEIKTDTDKANDAYVGLSVQEAQDLAVQSNTDFRIISIDGEGQPVTMDYRVGRLNATVESGVVTAINIEGTNEAIPQ